jgi:hypothetical protein
MTEVATSGGFELLAELERDGSITDVGLVLRREFTAAQYEALAVACGRMHRASAWTIGDLANHCDRDDVDGLSYEQIAEATGLAFQTVQNYASIARRVPRSRRRVGLPMSTHQAVSKLPPAKQKELLSRAVKEDWPRSRMREELDALEEENGAAPRQHVIPPDLGVLAMAVARAARETGDQYLVPGTVMRPLLAALGAE